MARYYHVCTDGWDGGDLQSMGLRISHGETVRQKWEDSTMDGYPDMDNVCLFRENQLEDALYFARTLGKRSCVILAVDADEWLERDIITNDEGYACVRWSIPAEYLSVYKRISGKGRNYRR